MRFWVLIKDGVVTNSIVWDGSPSWTPPEDVIMIETTGMENAPGPGWKYVDNTFLRPDPISLPVPKSITRRQCSLELLDRQMITDVEALAMTRNGIPPASVMSYIQTLPADQQVRAEIDFAADNYYRNNELLIAMMMSNGWSSDDIDDFFREALKK